jgi:uncharacterized repeat protein (TIGR01451 family)
MNRISRTLALLTVMLLGARQALAQQAPTLTVVAANSSAAADAARGAKRSDATARPGDVLHYTLRFTNVTAHEVRNVALSNPVPMGLRFVAGSAHASRADARLEFSTDNGRSWSAQPMDTVMVEGKPIVRPIPADRYTNVHWVVTGTVAPKAVVTADFDTRVAGGSSAPRAASTR